MRKYIVKTIPFWALLMVFLFPVGVIAAAAETDQAGKLEKMVDQQQKQIIEQQKAIDDLRNQMEALQKGGREAGAGPSQSAGGINLSGREGVNVQLYGQVNRALLYTHDGNESNFYNVDNDNSATRIGLNALAGTYGNIDLGAKIEVEFQTNDSNLVSQVQKNRAGDNHFRARHFDLFFTNEKFGKVSLGHGSTASDTASEVDLSGTDVVGYSDVACMAGGHFYYNSVTHALSGTTINDTFVNMDGLSRNNRLRYDSPVLIGLQGSTSIVSGGGFDMALRYSAQFGDFKLAAATAYAWHGSSSSAADYQLSGSASVLHTLGFSGTIACGKQNYKETDRGDDGTFLYLKGGYQQKFITTGTTALSLDYGIYNDIDRDGDDGRTLGLMAVQNIDKWASEVYAGLRCYDLDRTGRNYDNIHALMAGFRLKF